ncbi:MAG: 4'-phosphopantetheinyl transferase superfamily protein [Defluviitaleaceae bacterium]|nr:4'-phosphopantetheinyl transferase superfamily protein [Defluviitaleaceae bacterium]
MKILHLNLSNINEDDDWRSLLPFISTRRREKINRYKHVEDKVLSLYGELMIRMGLSKELGLNNDELTFNFNEYGKPYCHMYSHMKFNLSHTRTCIIVCFSENKEVGIDVERLINPPLEIMDLCFHKNEIDYVNNPKISKIRSFFEIWTKKEAYLKWKGTGMVSDLDKIDTCSVDKKFYSYISEDYLCTVCSEDVEEVEVQSLSKEDLVDFFLHQPNELVGSEIEMDRMVS